MENFNTEIADRADSLKKLSDRLNESELRQVTTKRYSEISLHVMAQCSPEQLDMMVKSQYSARAVNRLSEAFMQDKITASDFFSVIKQSGYSPNNSAYIGEFLESLKDIDSHTAANCLNAMDYENCDYHQTLNYVMSGAFYPTDFASLSLTEKVARELHGIDVPLRACEGYNHCYDVTDLQYALDRKSAIFVQDKDLAVKVHELMQKPDWKKFLKIWELSAKTEPITANDLDYFYQSFRRDELYDLLKQKAVEEYSDFCENIQKESPDKIIDAAHEIVFKEEIVYHLRYNMPKMDAKQYEKLLSAENVLEEIYNTWGGSNFTKHANEIDDALKQTADNIEIQPVLPEKTELKKPQSMKKR